MTVSRQVLAVLAFALLAFVVSSGAGLAAADGRSVEQAQALFKRYVALEQAFDPAAADLYSDAAVIRNTRIYPTGEVRELSFPARDFKALIRQAMPLAKARGDRNTYSNCTYEGVGDRVRITCSRYSELKKYTSPLTLLVGSAPTGTWLIFEELSESRP